MASSIAQALGGSQGGYTSGQINDSGISSFKYQAANIETVKPEASTLHQVFDTFLANTAPVVKDVVDDRKQSAKDDYLVKKAQLERGDITQQDFNHWVNNGDVWYKDNPFARKVARQDLGLQARHEADAKVMEDLPKLIGTGEIKTRDDLNGLLAQRRKQSTDDYAKLYGFDTQNEDYLKGIGNGLVDSDISIHEEFSKGVSKNQQNSDQNVAATNLNSIATDTSITDAHTKAVSLAATHNRYNTNGIYYNPDEQVKSIQNTVVNLSTQPNGGATVREFGEQTVTIGGKQMKVKDVVGPDLMQKATVDGDTSTTRLDNNLNTKMSDEIDTIDHLPVEQRDAALKKFEQDHPEVISTSGEQTPWTKRLQQSRDKARADADEAQQKAVKAQEDEVKKGRADKAMQDNVSTALATPGGQVNLEAMPWDSTTMGSKEEAYTREMARRMQLIDSDKTLDEQQRNEKKLELLKVDKVNRNGAVKSQWDGITSGAVGEWHSMSMNGKDNGNHPNLDNLASMYKTNPMAVRQMLADNKDADEILTKLDLMNSLHYSVDDELQAEAALNTMTPAQRDQIKKTATDNITNNTDFSGVPLNIQNQSQQVFNLTYARTGGNTQAATTAQVSYIKNHTTFFKTGGHLGFGGTDNGAVPSQMLMINNDPNSVPVVQQGLTDWISKNTSGMSNVTISPRADGQTLEVYDSQTNKSYVINQADLGKMYNDKVNAGKQEQVKAREEKVEENKGTRQVAGVVNKITPASALGFGQ